VGFAMSTAFERPHRNLEERWLERISGSVSARAREKCSCPSPSPKAPLTLRVSEQGGSRGEGLEPPTTGFGDRPLRSASVGEVVPGSVELEMAALRLAAAT